MCGWVLPLKEYEQEILQHLEKLASTCLKLTHYVCLCEWLWVNASGARMPLRLGQSMTEDTNTAVSPDSYAVCGRSSVITFTAKEISSTTDHHINWSISRNQFEKFPSNNTWLSLFNSPQIWSVNYSPGLACVNRWEMKFSNNKNSMFSQLMKYLLFPFTQFERQYLKTLLTNKQVVKFFQVNLLSSANSNKIFGHYLKTFNECSINCKIS